GFKEAYKKYIEGGWPSMPAPEEVGGQGLPKLINIVMSEILGSANWSWYMYPGLSHGAIHTLMKHGTPEQQEVYLTKLVSGEWTGT
ncbi:MAG TPA: acyl-CoA dehydrogenase, partial [Gammaproteobacteria bacterium]|nr:acyl-CoA dehydrogenase [Gammaproteobacteria bacterium]